MAAPMRPAPAWTARAATIRAPCRRPDVIEEVLDAEAILIDPRSGNSYRLNETALLVWSACDGQTTTREIAQHVSQTFEIDFDAALDHVEQVIALLAEAGLFAPVSEP